MTNPQDRERQLNFAELQLSKQKISWLVPSGLIEAMRLPRPRISEDRGWLISDSGQHNLGVAIFAKPRADGDLSRFWTSTTPDSANDGSHLVAARQMLVRPPISLDEFEPGQDAPLSAIHPHVLMENKTPYEIDIRIPRDLINQWSENKERPVNKPGFGFEWREVYQEQTNVGVAIALDGTTPLMEKPGHDGLGRPVRRQLFWAVDEDDLARSEGQDEVLLRFAQRHVSSGVANEDGEYPTAEYDLMFKVTGQQGTDSNRNLTSTNGLVHAVFVTYPVAERVLGYMHRPLARVAMPGSKEMMGIDLRAGSTEGRTEFIEGRMTTTKIDTVKSVTPIASVQLALVGEGGSTPGNMEEAHPAA